MSPKFLFLYKRMVHESSQNFPTKNESSNLSHDTSTYGGNNFLSKNKKREGSFFVKFVCPMKYP
jgi:hypothetical protein